MIVKCLQNLDVPYPKGAAIVRGLYLTKASRHRVGWQTVFGVPTHSQPPNYRMQEMERVATYLPFVC